MSIIKNRILILVMSYVTLSQVSACSEDKMQNDIDKFQKLTPEEERVIIYKGTERPFTGKYWNTFEKGTYNCKRCGSELYHSEDKFDSHCGWPSYDDEIEGAVKRQTDADGKRTEILCAKCDAHLGHVFEGEKLTKKDVRHCVNSISMEFIPKSENIELDTAIFAGGCFWGVEYFFSKEKGVISTTVGYIGGKIPNPTYEQVCEGNSGHIEAVEVVFNPKLTNYETLAKLFFETHDPTQWNRQGPDYGEQYRSVIFYTNDQQRELAEKLISILKQKKYKVVTELRPAVTFWKAETYHQDYYQYKGSRPYCHFYTKRFD